MNNYKMVILIKAFMISQKRQWPLRKLSFANAGQGSKKVYSPATQNSFQLSGVERMRMKNLVLATVVSCCLFSCKKESERPDTLCFDGLVRYMGSPAADGLGWVLYKEDSVSGQTYIPQNLSDGFKVDRLKVSACVYKTDEKFSCFCTAPLDVYRIVSIKRR